LAQPMAKAQQIAVKTTIAPINTMSIFSTLTGLVLIVESLARRV
jgi:hypothetical protein